LEGNDLCLELVVELLQHLLLAGRILPIENRLLPVAIDQACYSFICSFMSVST